MRNRHGDPFSSRLVHRVFAGVVLALTFGLLGVVVAGGGRGLYKECVYTEISGARTSHLNREETAVYLHGYTICTVIGLFVTTPVAFWLLAWTTTSHLCRVSEYAATLWANEWNAAAYHSLECAGFHAAAIPFIWIYNLTFVVSIVYFWVLTLRQVRSLERSSFVNLGSRGLLRACASGTFFGVLVAAAFRLARGPSGSPLRMAAAVLMWILAAHKLGAMCVFLRAATLVLELIHEARQCEFAMLTEEARNAPRSLRFQRVGVAVGAVSTLLALLSRFWISDLLWPLPAPSAEVRTPEFLVLVAQGVSLVDATLNTLASVALSGAYFGALRGGIAQFRSERARVLTRRRSFSEWSPTGDADWCGKVEELAGRGLTLQALMDFYQTLGKGCMPHFDPERHTTEDLVWGAIIPLSASSRSSAAEVLMCGKRVEPETMVTHNWGNLFVDLIAAIVGNALGEKDFCKVTHLLIHDVELLQRWITQGNVGQRTYWVCAFSVNQHSCICSANPERRRDSVTGEEYKICECGLPKAFNSTAPLSEGHSVPCELNKFDPMMLLLSQRNARFSQVVAIDKEFNIFNRAWCIAEIATAHSVGMLQTLQLPSRFSLEKKQDKLGNLKIRDMQASRPEDKEEILSRIEDHSAFDRRLRDLLVGQLLPSWSTLDSSDQMLQAGRIARWQSVSRKHSNKIWVYGIAELEEYANHHNHRT